MYTKIWGIAYKPSCTIIQLQQLSNHGQSCFLSNPTKSTLPLFYYLKQASNIIYLLVYQYESLKNKDALKKHNHKRLSPFKY